MEWVKYPCSGNEHGVVKGIGVVNRVHSAGVAGDFDPIDSRVYAPETEGKSQNDPFRERFLKAVTDKLLQARTLLFDAWYGSAENLKRIHRSGGIFFTRLPSGRDRVDG
jgi:hypothetical protein